MKRFWLLVVVSSIIGCDESKSDVDALRTEVTELRAELATLRTQLSAVESLATENGNTLADYAATVAAASALFTFLRVEDGDLIIEGANLYVQDGTGDTEGAVGKGNLIVGYDEPRTECVGGANAGNTCFDSATCGGGTCQPVADPQKTGSHNLIVGRGHRYPRYGAAVFGEMNTSDGSAANVLGGFNNTAAGALSSVVAGSNNVVAGSGSVILGGGGNTIAAGQEHQTLPAIQ